MSATSRGIVKKVKTADFANARTRGIVALNLDKDDKLVSARLTGGSDEVMLITRRGYGLRFHEYTVRSMGRASRGVIGIRLGKGDELTGVVRVDAKNQMLLVSEFGYGKRIEFGNFSTHGRGTKGQICYKISEKSGELAGALAVLKKDVLVCITSQGNTIKLRLREIPVQGKAAMGVKIVNIEKPDLVVGIARVAK